jgi:hypothetical protein
MPHDRLRNRVVTSANELTVPRWWSCGAIAISLTASQMPSRMSLLLADKRTCVPAAAMSALCQSRKSLTSFNYLRRKSVGCGWPGEPSSSARTYSVSTTSHPHDANSSSKALASWRIRWLVEIGTDRMKNSMTATGGSNEYDREPC